MNRRLSMIEGGVWELTSEVNLVDYRFPSPLGSMIVSPAILLRKLTVVFCRRKITTVSDLNDIIFV